MSGILETLSPEVQVAVEAACGEAMICDDCGATLHSLQRKCGREPGAPLCGGLQRVADEMSRATRQAAGLSS